jgi:hypothetical protein
MEGPRYSTRLDEAETRKGVGSNSTPTIFTLKRSRGDRRTVQVGNRPPLNMPTSNLLKAASSTKTPLPTMPVLLELPREIRNFILELLVAAYTAPQPLPTGLTKYHDYDTNCWLPGSDVKYSNFIKTDIVPTILVNRQLNEETLSVIDRILERQSYLLEATVFEENELRVKWVSVPALVRVIPIRITFFSIELRSSEALNSHASYFPDNSANLLADD